ncbi:MAG: tRNA epoxyqueuosine(34) reductase QueG [Bacteroidetes bacterium]|nr:tRNA epoxyqueuosine(34) reductase QueG [Bacteroidota bacterium]
MNSSESLLSEEIKQKAFEIGFSACGISKIENLDSESDFLENWINKGFNAEMNYLKNHKEKRRNPALLLENSVSVISLLISYSTDEKLDDASFYKIAKYAYGKDYHEVIKAKLEKLMVFIKEKTGTKIIRGFVDSAPFFEKPWAAKSGLGWIGKNSLLINKELGSYVFIGEIITDVQLKYDLPFENSLCGNCNKCIEACPTNAINDNCSINASKCIAYHTIESKSDLPENLNFNNYIYGCDICQDACPWNQKLANTKEDAFHLNPKIKKLTKSDWENLTEAAFKEIFAESAMNRVKYHQLIRNINFVTK